MDIPQLVYTYAAVDGYFGNCQFGGITHKASKIVMCKSYMNRHITFLLGKSMSGMAESYINFMLRFSGNSQTFYKVSVPFYI